MPNKTNQNQTKIPFFFFILVQLGKVRFAMTQGLCSLTPLEQAGSHSPPQLPRLAVLPLPTSAVPLSTQKCL